MLAKHLIDDKSVPNFTYACVYESNHSSTSSSKDSMALAFFFFFFFFLDSFSPSLSSTLFASSSALRFSFLASSLLRRASSASRFAASSRSMASLSSVSYTHLRAHET